MSINLIKGSCADQEVDAIVNAANKYLLAGSGICGAIFKKAGLDELQAECNTKNIPLNDGDAVITKPYGIKNAKGIIHAVGPNFSITPNDFESLFNAYYNSLKVLMENDLHSISFPLISSGIFGGNLENPVGESTIECLRAYYQFLEDYSDYEISVVLCAFTDKEYALASQVFNNYDRESDDYSFKRRSR